MRLLTADGAPELRVFNNEASRPDYAILSHTWGPEEDEVLFYDLSDLTKATLKTGWLKIDYTRKEALRKGLEYVWIDTCCIDKSSSAELTEAINSMFKWYQKAAACYVYLYDVQYADQDEPNDPCPTAKQHVAAHAKSKKKKSPSSNERSDQPTSLHAFAKNSTDSCLNEEENDKTDDHYLGDTVDHEVGRDYREDKRHPWSSLFQSDLEQSQFESFLPRTISWPEHVEIAFRHSRYFTRGWTLQELLAPNPSHVYFFSAQWRYLGPLPWLRHLVGDITGIHASLLLEEHVRRLDAYSVAQRMSWASRRTTTRPEDVAYCLLGIFNINMPIIYGEGDKAFFRLQQEILRNSQDHSILAWKGSPRPRMGVTPPRTDHLLGRSISEAVTLGPCMGQYPLLAPNPSYFELCGDIVSLPLDYNGAIQVSSVGIRANFRFLRGVAVLNCSKSDTCSDAIGVGMMYLKEPESCGDIIGLRLDHVEQDSFFAAHFPVRSITLAWDANAENLSSSGSKEKRRAPVVMFRSIRSSTSVEGTFVRDKTIQILTAEPATHWNARTKSFVLQEQYEQLSKATITENATFSAAFDGELLVQVQPYSQVVLHVEVLLGIKFKRFRVAFAGQNTASDITSWKSRGESSKDVCKQDGLEITAEAYITKLLNQEVILVELAKRKTQRLEHSSDEYQDDVCASSHAGHRVYRRRRRRRYESDSDNGPESYQMPNQFI